MFNIITWATAWLEQPNSWLFLPLGHYCETCCPLPSSQPRWDGIMQLISSSTHKAQRAPCCAGPPAPVLGHSCPLLSSPAQKRPREAMHCPLLFSGSGSETHCLNRPWKCFSTVIENSIWDWERYSHRKSADDRCWVQRAVDTLVQRWPGRWNRNHLGYLQSSQAPWIPSWSVQSHGDSYGDNQSSSKGLRSPQAMFLYLELTLPPVL